MTNTTGEGIFSIVFLIDINYMSCWCTIIPVNGIIQKQNIIKADNDGIILYWLYLHTNYQRQLK